MSALPLSHAAKRLIKAVHSLNKKHVFVCASTQYKSRKICCSTRKMNKHLFEGDQHAGLYSHYRPMYGADVYSAIVDFCYEGECGFNMAVDVACGTGQSTFPLSEYFKNVIGMDTSEAQIKEALKCSNNNHIKFLVGQAEDLTFLESCSVDLLTAAQAMHWFDLHKFFAEVNRVLKPGATVAVYGYSVWKLDNSTAQQYIHDIYRGVLGKYWDAERKHVEDSYSQLKLPFPGWIRKNDLEICKQMTVDAFVGYASTWSAYQKYHRQYPDEHVLLQLKDKLKCVYAEDESFTVRWPIFMMLGRKPL